MINKINKPYLMIFISSCVKLDYMLINNLIIFNHDIKISKSYLVIPMMFTYLTM